MLYYGALVCGAILLVIFLFVQYEKYRMNTQLRHIKNANAYYNEGAILNKSFFLEERMLLCTEKLKIQELYTKDVHTISANPLPNDKYTFTINSITILLDNKLQVERLLAYIKKRSPEVQMNTLIDPKGDGTLTELKKE